MDLTDKQWAIVEPLFRWMRRRPDGRGRPPRDAREVLNGVLWILRTGAPWKDLPDRYPPYQTCHRRFQDWQRAGVLRDLLACLAEDLRQRGKLDLTEGSSTPASARRNKGLLHRSNETWQRQQNHGNRQPPQSSSRRARGQRFAS
jgi:transposase